jgi:signal transduction histidine kinase
VRSSGAVFHCAEARPVTFLATVLFDSPVGDVYDPHPWRLCNGVVVSDQHDVSVARQGVPQPLESATDQAAYRILQEALTNAARHGTGAARVELVFGEAALELTISNPTRDESAPRANDGHGLTGMRERAILLGGTFDAARHNGAFRVSARLPYRGPSA